MLQLERVPVDQADWAALDAQPDRVVFQTREWLRFLEETQGAEPVLARLRDGTSDAGWFTGAIVRRFGVKILGSPFPGWTTASMGFNLHDGVERQAAVRALTRFAFRELGCLHLELKDRELGHPELAGLGFGHSETITYEIDLTADEETLLSRMSSSARRNIRLGERNGLTVERGSGEPFADDFHAQLTDVFAKHGLTPTYGVERVRALIRHLEPSGNLVLLRARTAEGESAATAIFPGINGTCYFWGGASWRRHYPLRPNELLFWHVMREWKQRGAATLDTAGGGAYKEKYGPRGTVHVPHFRKARLPGLLAARDLAERVVRRGRD